MAEAELKPRPWPLYDSCAHEKAGRATDRADADCPLPLPTPPRRRSIRLRLDAIKSHLRYEFAGSLRPADALANEVGTAVATTGRPESINELFAAMDRLSPSDLQRVAAKYFQPSNVTAIILETETKK